MKRFLVAGISLIALGTVIISGCSVSDKKLNAAEKRIESLTQNGLPDSVLSPVSVYLYQAREFKKRHEVTQANNSADSMFILLKAAEKVLAGQKSNFDGTMSSYMANINTTKAKLTGLVLKEFSKHIAAIDSLTAAGKIFDAQNAARKTDSLCAKFEANQNLTESLIPLATGVWTCINKETNADVKEINAIEKKIFDFKKDGTCKLIENKKGQSKKAFKEDWEYVSLGTWGMSADTIWIFVDRFKAVRQIFESGTVNENGKVTGWTKDAKPGYDSLITDHSQDRYVNWADLKEDFVKGK